MEVSHASLYCCDFTIKNKLMYTTPSIGSIGPKFMTILWCFSDAYICGHAHELTELWRGFCAEMSGNDVTHEYYLAFFPPYLPSTACYAYVHT